MKASNNVLAIAGNFRVGKDFTFKFLNKYLPAKRIAFADELKRSVQTLCKDLYNIDVWTEDLVLKEKIRPTLVCVGNTARSLNENVWVDKVRPLVFDAHKGGSIPCITDCRFPNEGNFIQIEFNGMLVYVDRILPDGSLQPPANESEALNSPIMKSRADICIAARNLEELEQEVVTKIVPLFKK